MKDIIHTENTAKDENIQNNIILDKIIEVDSIKENSIVVIKITNPGPQLMGTLRNLIDRYGESLEKKNCALLIMGPDSDISLVNEEEMNKIGWEKKSKSNLILPA